MRLLGITDCVNTCECCGRTDLKCTVAFDTADGVVYYGRTCASRWYNKEPKEINKELKGIRLQANEEAQAIWRKDPALLAYDQLLIALNNGPRIPITERLERIRPYSEAASRRKAEIVAEIAPKYMLQASDIYLY